MKIKLRSLRLKRHMTMDELAAKALVSKSTISRIESGDIIPSVDIVCRLCVALNVAIGEMIDCKGGFDDDL